MRLFKLGSISWFAKEHQYALVLWCIFVLLTDLFFLSQQIDLLDISDTWITADPRNETTISAYTEQLKTVSAASLFLVGSLVGAITLGNALKRTKLQDTEAETNRDRLNADIYSRAVEQLGAGSVASRLGAIFSLEGLALSEMDRNADGRLPEQCFETLAAFVRYNATTDTAMMSSVASIRRGYWSRNPSHCPLVSRSKEARNHYIRWCKPTRRFPPWASPTTWIGSFFIRPYRLELA